jgi:ankyrin repeat protein
LIWASYENRVEVVKLLIEGGANLNMGDSVGRTALTWASSWNQVEVVKLLIEAGANLNIRDKGVILHW